MTQLPKPVRSTLTKLKRLDLTNETRDSLQTKIDETNELIERFGLSKNVRCSEELRNFVRIAQIHLDLIETERFSEVQAWDFDQGIRHYVGVSWTYKLKVTPNKDTCLLSRKYHKGKDSEGYSRIKINWRFSREGRIYLVDSFLFHNGEHLNLIKVEFKRDPYWKSAEAEYYELPPQITTLNSKFSYWNCVKRYQRLLGYGHLMAVYLLENIKNVKIEDLDRKDDEKPLQEIVKDNAAMYMIKNIAKRKPVVRESEEEGILTILY